MNKGESKWEKVQRDGGWRRRSATVVVKHETSRAWRGWGGQWRGRVLGMDRTGWFSSLGQSTVLIRLLEASPEKTCGPGMQGEETRWEWVDRMCEKGYPQNTCGK